MKIILQSKSSGGSGTGVSYYNSLLGCPRKAQLRAKEMENNPYNGMTGSLPLDIGTIFHEFLELYYTDPKARMQNPSAIQFVQDSGDPAALDEQARLEAERLFRAYRTKFPSDELGSVVALEEQLEGEVVESAVGVSPFTARLDMVVKIGVKDCRRLQNTRNIEVTPGYYIVDHKTATARYGNIRDIYTNSLQFTAYYLAWNAVHPKQKVQGTLVNIVFKNKEVRFETIVVPPPTGIQIKALHNMFRIAKSRDPDEANSTQCFMWGRTCKYLTDGLCDRT